MFTIETKRINYFYGSKYQNVFTDMEKTIGNIHFYNGFPKEEDFLAAVSGYEHTINVFDDLMLDINGNDWVEKMFTTHSHHYNATIIYIMQNPFQKGKNARNISVNQHYICLFRNLRDSLQIQTLGRQMFPGRGEFFMKSYKTATEKLYSYIICDLHPRSQVSPQLRTLIFPGENTIIYRDQ
jgi:hypothetical protein